MAPVRAAPGVVWFVLPAYDEERSIGELIERVDAVACRSGLAYRVLVIDDGSADRTAAIAREAAVRFPVEVVCNERNRGLGVAIERGLRLAAERVGDDDVVVTMDADLTQDPCFVPSMIEAYRAGADVVIASRFRPGSRTVGVSAFRRLMTLGARAVVGVLMPVRGVRDYSCGFRLYSAPVLRAAFAEPSGLVTTSGFACAVEILGRMRGTACFAEVPFELHYEEKRKASAMNVWRTVREYGGVIRRVRAAERDGRRRSAG